MTSPAAFFTIRCRNCRHVFEVPSLGDMNYGERYLHGDRGTIHRYVRLLDHPVLRVVEEVLRPQQSKQWDRCFRTLAALADPVEGQRLGLTPVCPQCHSDAMSFRKSHGAPAKPRIGEVAEATFHAFLALTPQEQRDSVAAMAGRCEAENGRK